ncbi:endonuclease [Agaricicola taiwanensis]|uniref:Endonuclease n=1 Tax=Agaricicola taiwanensis TaxID=591372 RepID=A0A8J2YK00_9RHOB|nr:endonuclease/exonuclease/phosphatase family protein [Agaricicola taiwanensis]GGE49118.1 endonuclease [Agaricicola taiwanensis]
MPRILTYNIHRCLGTDRRMAPDRIAEVISSCDPDIVCLQEVDVGRRRSGHIDQAQVLADALGMDALFHPSLMEGDEHYGNAILTSAPLKLVKADSLPGLMHRPNLEPRSIMWARLHLAGMDIQVFNTHLGLRGPERLAQIEALLGHDWLDHRECRDAVILAGDFNATPRSIIFQRLSQKLCDAQGYGLRQPQPTFHSRFPMLRLDHIFTSPKLEIIRAETIRTPLARVASDHLPLMVEFKPSTRH